MPSYIQNKKDLKRFLDVETAFYPGKWKRFLPINIGESQILLKHTYLLRKTEYYLNTGKKLRGGCADYDLLCYRISIVCIFRQMCLTLVYILCIWVPS